LHCAIVIVIVAPSTKLIRRDALVVRLKAPGEPAPAAPEPKPPGSLLSTEEAAAFLGIFPQSFRRLCRRKAITFIQVIAERIPLPSGRSGRVHQFAPQQTKIDL
jgi:hypothetical protein